MNPSASDPNLVYLTITLAVATLVIVGAILDHCVADLSNDPRFYTKTICWLSGSIVTLVAASHFALTVLGY